MHQVNAQHRTRHRFLLIRLPLTTQSLCSIGIAPRNAESCLALILAVEFPVPYFLCCLVFVMYRLTKVLSIWSWGCYSPRRFFEWPLLSLRYEFFDILRGLFLLTAVFSNKILLCCDCASRSQRIDSMHLAYFSLPH